MGAPVVCFQALVAIMVVTPQSCGGVAYDSMKAAIRAHDAGAAHQWYPFASVYSDRNRLRLLVASSIPMCEGRLQATLIRQLMDFRAEAVPYIPMLVKILLDKKS